MIRSTRDSPVRGLPGSSASWGRVRAEETLLGASGAAEAVKSLRVPGSLILKRACMLLFLWAERCGVVAGSNMRGKDCRRFRV